MNLFVFIVLYFHVRRKSLLNNKYIKLTIGIAVLFQIILITTAIPIITSRQWNNLSLFILAMENNTDKEKIEEFDIMFTENPDVSNSLVDNTKNKKVLFGILAVALAIWQNLNLCYFLFLENSNLCL